MKQINIKICFLISALILFVAGCQKLDQAPETQLSDANFWKTTSDLSQGANYLYSFLSALGTTDPTGNPTPYQDNYSDDAYGTGTVGVGDGSRIAPATSNEWTNFYKLIRASNNVIEKSAGVSGSPADINQYVGEARFFRAWGYFELLKRFGDVPYIDRTLTLNDPGLYTSRTNREIVVDSIYADLDYAAANLPQPDKAAYGRITATAALAYKSRVALFEGTWDKYHGGTNANKHLQIAVDAGNAVITGAKHSLYTGSGADSYYYEFQYSGGLTGNPIQRDPGGQVNYTYANNKENLLVRLYALNLANNFVSHTYERGGLEQGGITATKSFIDAYLYKDGLPVGKSIYDTSTSPTSTLTDFNNRDPRIAMTIWNKNMQFVTNAGLTNYIPINSYRIRKYWVVSDWNQQTSFVNFNVIRYAEVLLNYAEATFELNGIISDADLNLTINALRNRASNNNTAILPLLTNTFVITNGLDMLTEIRRERRVELAFEGFRYWDLLRWKIAEDVLPNAVLGPKYFAAEVSGAAPANLTPSGFVILQKAANRKFDAEKDYLWPLPTNELALDHDNLSQNPHWE